ncbi:MAG TPA: GNAT family N-acetyltransferase, partial [Acidimicrobiales bacterium]|nr:GNAT family N-acetyltransferase [Acidimicrobiales bacterium]
MHEVRRATDADRGQVATTLGRAFADDPVLRWLAAPDDGRYARTGPRAFDALLRVTYMPKAEVYMTADGNAAVVWVPPDSWKAPVSHTFKLLPPYLRLSGRRIGRLLKLVTAMEKRHARADEPHWYIPFIGTDPAYQSKGLGSALLAHVLARAD